MRGPLEGIFCPRGGVSVQKDGMLTPTDFFGARRRSRRAPALWALLGAVAALALLWGGAGCHRRSEAPAGEAAEVARGHELYQKMCAVCHGQNGEGYKADQATRLQQPEFLASASDDFIRLAIANGRTGTTMSAWGQARGGPLAPADVNAVVKFIRSWQKVPRAKLDERPPSGDVGRAGPLYTSECSRCHGERGVGGTNVHIGGAGFLASASNGFLRYAIERGRPGTDMPAFSGKLKPQDIDDMVLLLRSWAVPVAPPPPAKPPPLPLGPVPLNPKGPEPVGFLATPKMTSVDTVKGQLDRHARMALLDARAPSDFAREHIAGAVSVPFYDPEPYFDKLPKDAWLVCYCSCPHAESGTLARKLAGKGFTKVTVLDEGLGVWKSRGYPVASGEKP